MGNIRDAFETVWRDYVTAGVPASGDHEPVKSEIRAIGATIETAFGASLGNVDVAYATLAELNADLAWAAASTAIVYADPDPANIDLYVKSGASGAGSWANTDALHTLVAALADPAVERAGNSVPFLSWADLAAATDMAAGDRATVLAIDTGTHTDPVAGGTVANAGVYRYSASPAGWERVASLDSALAEAAADRAEAASVSYLRYGSLEFPHSNGLSENPDRAAMLELPGFAGITTLGTSAFWDGPSSILVFFDVHAEMQDGQNMTPYLFAMGGAIAASSSRILQMRYHALYHLTPATRRKVVIEIRGETAASAVWTMESAELPAGRYAALVYNDGTNGYFHCLNLDSRAWLDGPAAAKPAGWAGMPQARAPFVIGGAAASIVWPPVVGASVAPGSAYRGSLSNLLFANTALSKANVETIANGADPVATATGAGATKYLHAPLVSGGEMTLAVETTQSGMGAGLTAYGSLRAGQDMRQQAASGFLTLDRLPNPACICLRPNADATPLQISGRTDRAFVDQFRLVSVDDGRPLTDWLYFRGAVTAGEWSGTAYLPADVTVPFQLQVRSSATPALIAASHSRCLIGPAFDIWGQSEGQLSTYAFNRSIATGGLDIKPEGDTDNVVFAAWAQDTGYPRVSFLGSSYDRNGWLGDVSLVLANRLSNDLGRPAFIRAHTVSGTSLFSLMNDADAARSWADVENAIALMANRGERGEALSCGHIFVGWEAAFSGSGDVIAGMYAPFLFGIGNAATTSTVAIAQADIDHHLRDGTFNPDAPVVLLPCNRVTNSASLLAFDDNAEANQRDWFRNYAHLYGYIVGPETIAHKMQGENAAGGIPAGAVTHAEGNDYEGNIEQAFINTEAMLLAYGRGTYPGPVFFETVRAGSAANKVIVRVGDPRPYPGEGLAAGATGYSRAAQRVVHSAIKLHTKKAAGNPGAGFEARRKPSGGSFGAWSKANVTSGAIINPREVELTLAWSLSAGDEVEIRYASGSPGNYDPAVITQANWRAGLLYFTGEPYDGDPNSYDDLRRLGFAVAGSNQALAFVA